MGREKKIITQIFMRRKSHDSKKAERFFKERNEPVQLIDLDDKGMSPGEFESVLEEFELDDLVDPKAPKDLLTRFEIASHQGKVDLLFEEQRLLIAPIVRRGKRVSVGHQEKQWISWLQSEQK
ncbi:arsenate reductase family protein [Guggenheimella bovis]